MRLFGVVDGVINRLDRAGMGMTRPFDLAFAQGVFPPPILHPGGEWVLPPLEREWRPPALEREWTEN